MNYTIGEISKEVNIPVSTLRYYDKKGLIPFVERTDGNIRIFDDTAIEGLKMLKCLKTTGMELNDIKTFFDWCKIGDQTIEKRYDLFIKQKEETERQIAELQKALKLINYKVEYYKIAKKHGSTDIPELNEELAMKYLSEEDE